MKTILKISNLNKTFGKVHAVKNLSLTIEKGNTYGLLGPNGSGKSTTLGIVLNVVNKTSGEFTWFDGNISTHQALKKVGAIIERPNFYPYMSATQNLELVCKIKEISTERIEAVLKTVNLYERKDSKFQTFSLGMKQRLAIASALLNNPEILILDEPTNGLDPQGIHEIRSIIKNITQTGTTILLASHLLDEVEKICSHVIIIRNGEKLYEGRVDEITNSFGFIDIQAEGNETTKLIDLSSAIKGVSKAAKNGNVVTLHLSENISASEVNQYLFNQGIVLSHLVKRKPNLEEQFLSITQ